MVQRSERASARLRFLDAARGLTMIFVLLSHFAFMYFTAPEQKVWSDLLGRIGMIATPTFVILSGMVLGLQYQAAGAGFGRIQARFIDRGLFLLLVGHVIISLALWRFEHSAVFVYSTDGLGIAMIFGALLVPKLEWRSRLGLGVILYVGSWLAVYFWQPTPGAHSGEVVKELMFGSLRPTALGHDSFAVVPWFAVYLTSSLFGERLAALRERGAIRRLATDLGVLGVAGITAMGAIKVAALEFGLSPLTGKVTTALLRVGQKAPPAPLYLLFYGGIGLLLIYSCFLAETRNCVRRVFRCAELCGEASLFVFFAHFWMYWGVPVSIGSGGLLRGFVYFALSTTMLVMAAVFWQRGRYNRLFTVRYGMGSERFAGLPTRLRLETVPVMWVDGARG
jgi:uncharacterized membrane protein